MNEKMRADLQLTTVHELNMMLFGQPDLACCYKIVDKFSPSFELVTFLESLNFTHTFTKSGRKSIYFGEFPYSYAGGQHQANPLNTNQYVFEMFCFMCRTFPLFDVNSCLINYYPNSSCLIPFHADDESCIHPGSFIFTISLGATRTLSFKKVGRCCSDKHNFLDIEVSNGDIVVFSKSSQSKFVHGILPEHGYLHSPRVSATFRKITDNVVPPEKK